MNPQLILALAAFLLLLSCGRAATPKAAVSPVKPIPSALPTIVPTATLPPTATPRPSPTSTPTSTSVPTPTPTVNIVVEAPKAGQKVTSPARVAGSARVYEGTVVVQVKDAQGKVLQQRSLIASEGAPAWGRFTVELPFAVKGEQPGTIHVFSPSPRDGSPINSVAVHVTLVGP